MNFREKLKKVKAFVLDVDGVLGSHKVLLHPSGEMMRTMNIKDGYAMQYAVKKGYLFAIITGGTSEAVRNRFINLGINDVYLKAAEKMPPYMDFVTKHNLMDDEILYMGDDIPDYEVMKKSGMPCCPYDAAEEVKSISVYISDKIGGEGCVRDVIEQVLKVQGNWMCEKAFKW